MAVQRHLGGMEMKLPYYRVHARMSGVDFQKDTKSNAKAFNLAAQASRRGYYAWVEHRWAEPGDEYTLHSRVIHTIDPVQKEPW